VVLLVTPATLNAAEQHASLGANPIRKVVTMLQAMQKRVTEEGEKEKALYDKFMCYCKSTGNELASSVEAAESKLPQLTSEIQTAEERKEQKEEELEQAKSERSTAEVSLADAAAIREKEAEAFSNSKASYDADMGSLAGAVKALENGGSGSFLQTATAQALYSLATRRSSLLIGDDHDELLAFLEDRQGPGESSEVLGILKTLGEEMAKRLRELIASEHSSQKDFDDLNVAKHKEAVLLTKKIEMSLDKVGELGVSITQMKNDLGDTEESLSTDKSFAANLQNSCSKKAAEWEERTKRRAEELVTLADTIKMLNDDDALDLFKKTLPSPAASFMQVQVTEAALRSRARAILQGARGQRLDLVEMALRGRKIGFEEVCKMIDEMIAALKSEQVSDDDKKAYCSKEFDLADNKKRGLKRSVADEDAAIDSAEEGLSSLIEEVGQLETGIKDLDKSVTSATEQRKTEHEEFMELMASDSAAKELLNFAKNRLNKFYNPKMYHPKQEETEEGVVFAHIAQHTQHKEAPETFGEYSKKSEETAGVMAMIDKLISHLDMDMTRAKAEEKDAQADYETMMKDSGDKRVADSKLLTEKEAIIGDVKEDLAAHKDEKVSVKREFGATRKYIRSLHTECDLLLKYFSVRREARSSEIDALGKAKAVLRGADYS